MQTEQIVTFLDLCDTRSFNQTAERLGVTQSTVSGRIRALEDELACKLFTRSRAGTALTSAGLRFEPHARGIRHGWTTAREAVAETAGAALRLRVGMQHDLAGPRLAGWIAAFRGALPGAVYYFEPDYSAQMCSAVEIGELDIALIFTPIAHPDLHFMSLGELTYRMIADRVADVTEIDTETYLQGNFSPAFAETHRALLPRLSRAPVTLGLDAGILELMQAIGGAGYVLEETARHAIAENGFARVKNAPDITQPVFVVVHARNRHRTMHRRLISVLSHHFLRNLAKA